MSLALSLTRRALLATLVACAVALPAAAQSYQSLGAGRVRVETGPLAVERIAVRTADQARALLDSLQRHEDAPGRAGGLDLRTIEPGGAPEGDGVNAIAFTPSGTRMLTANAMSGNVSVFDAASGALLATIPVGDSPMDVEATEEIAVVPCADADAVYVLDLASYTVRRVVTGLSAPGTVLLLPGGRALIRSLLTDVGGIVNLSTGAIEVSLPLFPYALGAALLTDPSYRIYYLPRDIVLAPDGGSVFVGANAPLTEIYEYSTTTGQILRTIPVGVSPSSLVLAADGETLVVGDVRFERGVQRVALSDGTAGAVRRLPPGFEGVSDRIAVDETGRRALVSVMHMDSWVGATVLLDLDTGAAETFDTASFDTWMQTRPDGRTVVGVGSTGAAVFDFEQRAVVASVDDLPVVVGAASPDGARIGGVQAFLDETVHTFAVGEAGVEFASVAIPGGRPEGDTPYGLSVTPDGATVLVANVFSSNLTHLDVATRAAVRHTPLPFAPLRVVALGGNRAIASGIGLDAAGARGVTTALVDLESGAVLGALPDVLFDGFLQGRPSYAFAHDGAGGLTVLRDTGGGLEVVASPALTLTAWSAAADGSVVAVTDGGMDEVHFFSGDGARLAVASVPSPGGVAVAPDGRTAFVVSEADRSVHRFRVDAAGATPDGTFSCNCVLPGRLATDGQTVALATPGHVLLFDAATGTETGREALPEGDVIDLAVRPNGGAVAVTFNVGTEVPSALTLGGVQFPLPNGRSDFAYVPAADAVFLANPHQDLVLSADGLLVPSEAPAPAPAALSVTAYPNPTAGPVTLRLAAALPGTVAVEAFDMLGRRVATWTVEPHGGEATLAWTPPTAGVYTLRAQQGTRSATARVTSTGRE